MRTTYKLYLAMGLLLYMSCQKLDDLDDLNFFEVSIESINTPTELGVLTLEGRINEQNFKDIETQGFIWSTNINDVEHNSTNAQRVEAIRDDDGRFSNPINKLSANSIYYFRAYAMSIKKGEEIREVFSNNIESFTFNTQPQMLEDYSIINDQAIIKGQLAGLSNDSWITEYGFVYSATNPAPEYDKDSLILSNNMNNDNRFDALLTDLDFNTEYYVRCWAKNEMGCVFQSKNTISLPITDGWRKISSLPHPLAKAVAISDVNRAIVGLGSSKRFMGSDVFYEFNPNANEKRGEWTAVFQNFSPSNRNNCIAFSGENTFFVGTGENIPMQPSVPFLVLHQIVKLNFNPPDWTDCPAIDFPTPLASAVNFREGTNIYVGTGTKTINGIDINDTFWSLDLNTLDSGWQIKAALPVRINAVDLDKHVGRYEAISFTTADNRHFVGGGYAPSIGVLNDLWEFIPPNIVNNQMGEWEFVGFLPGTPRRAAVALIQNNRVYYGMGDSFNNGELSDWWEFSPNNTWEKRTALPLIPFVCPNTMTQVDVIGRSDAMTFTTGEIGEQRGFLGGGTVLTVNGTTVRREYLNDFWEYIPAE